MSSGTLPPSAAVVAALCAAAPAAVQLPLTTCAVTLAVPGLVHGVVGLRTVDRRIGPRVPWPLGTTLLLATALRPGG